MLKHSFRYYIKYFFLSIGFSISLLALIVVLSYTNFDIFFGSLNYTLIYSTPAFYVAILAILFSTLIQSFFTTLLVFSVRKELQQGYKRVYILEVLKDFIWEVFSFNFTLNVLLFVLFVFFIYFNVGFLLPFIYITLLIILMYVNQSIIIDELGLFKAIKLGFDFVKKESLKTFSILFVVFVINLLVGIITYYIPGGYIISLLLIHILLIPLYEIMKTVMYMTKFRIIESDF